MAAFKQSVVFAAIGCLSGAILAYIDAYHVLVIDETFKFHTPAAVWRFQFDIWWWIVFIMAFIFGCATQVLRNFFKRSNDSPQLLLSALSAVAIMTLLVVEGKFLENSAGFLLIVLAGPILAAALIAYKKQCRLDHSA